MSQFNFLDAIGTMFIGLKLAAIIQWNWFFVLLPLIISMVEFIVSNSLNNERD